MIWPLPEEDQDGERKAKEIRRKGSVVNRKKKEETFYGPHKEERMVLLPSGMKREEREEKW